MESEKDTKLCSLRERIASCENCDLSKTRQHTIPGFGLSTADIMIVGIAVPYYLERDKRPFTGSTGETIRQVMEQTGIVETRSYLTNLMKCALPRQDSSVQIPCLKKISACSCWLQQEIEIIRPRIIITLGIDVLRQFFPGFSVDIFQKDMPKEMNGITFFALHHPANFHRGAIGPFAKYETKPIETIREYISSMT